MQTSFNDYLIQGLLEIVYQEVPAILSLMDNRRDSETYGCFFPLFWRERKVEFANVRAQEATLTLALLYSRKYENSPYYKKKELLKYVIAGMEYWTKLQHRDGSFDEWRHLEHGQAGTAFSVVAMASAYELIKGFLTSDLKKRCKSCFRKSAIFLSKNSDLTYVNHEAVSIYAMYLCYCLLKNQEYLETVKEKLSEVMKSQSSEGWFREGNGPDTGYNTVTLTYLALYYRKSNDDSILPMLKKAVEFNSYFLYPDGLTGGGFNSRCAGMLFPLGFIILAEKTARAKQLAIESLLSFKNGKMDGLYNLDDMRKSITLYLLLWSYDEAKKRSFNGIQANLPTRRTNSFTRHMNHAEILLVKTPVYYLIVGTRKGCIGGLYSYDANQTLQMSSPIGSYCISGIYGKTTKKSIISTQWGMCKRPILKKNSVLSTLLVPQVNTFDKDTPFGSRIIDRHPLLFFYHLASELGLRHKVSTLYEKTKVISMSMLDKWSRPLLRLDRKITWEDKTIKVKNDFISLRNEEFEELYAAETFVLPRDGNSRITANKDSLDYIVNGKKVMMMKVKGDSKIHVKRGDESDLAFNNVQPVIVLVPFIMQDRKESIVYSFVFNSSRVSKNG